MVVLVPCIVYATGVMIRPRTAARVVPPPQVICLIPSHIQQ
jgi:hypothetical protein